MRKVVIHFNQGRRNLPYPTDEKLKSYLDTNQLHREQMCRAILATDKRFSEVRPRHPRGGRDGGRDIQAYYREEERAFGAVGFVNQANDSNKQKRQIKKKFSDDFENALEAKSDLSVFVFFTNLNLTIGEKEDLVEEAKEGGILHCEIFDRERIRIELDSPDGFSIRFQYLNITLSEEEQASFFSRWGDDIQSVISSGFQEIGSVLNRLLFLQEANNPVSYLTLSFELNKKYEAEEIEHFRLFCWLTLKEPKHNILSILFGSSDKSNRIMNSSSTDFTNQESGIKNGISTGQWERHIDLDEPENSENDSNNETIEWAQVGAGNAIGKEEVKFLPISYAKSSFVRFLPIFRLRELDNAMFIPFVNKSLAEKIKGIHIYSNGYKLQEIDTSDITIDDSEVDPGFPIEFSKKELNDKWVRLRPEKSSAYWFRFFEHTPKRMFKPDEIQDSIDRSKN